MASEAQRTVKIEKLPWGVSPQAVMAAWPEDRWLCAMLSAGQGERDRWSVLAEPVSATPVLEGGKGRTHLTPKLGIRPHELNMPDLGVPADEVPPFVGGWIASLRYELGGLVEPSAGLSKDPGGWRAVWFNCPCALVHDHKTGAWWRVETVEGVTAASPAENADAAGADGAAATPPATPQMPESLPPFALGKVTSSAGMEGYTRAVKIALGHIADGDIYQVNLTHNLRCPFSGSARSFMSALCAKARPWYGAYLEYPLRGGLREVVVSGSPELFLTVSPTGRVTTRPMKGTRTVQHGAEELAGSEKEAAELTMIVDLMRSDLGRVCEPGSIVVEHARDIEQHASGTLLQATATVTGQLRSDATFDSLLAATFPGGSVTGAPKVRAMSIIERVEREARGQYCGSVGMVSHCGRASFSIAIRTASIVGRPVGKAVASFAHGSGLCYGVGAGIVADSRPDSEWQETLDKGKVLLEMAGVSEVIDPVIEREDMV